MYCMWLANKGDWNGLISDFLEPPHKDDCSSEAGSVMLEELQSEFEERRFKTDLLNSDNLGESQHSFLSE